MACPGADWWVTKTGSAHDFSVHCGKVQQHQCLTLDHEKSTWSLLHTNEPQNTILCLHIFGKFNPCRPVRRFDPPPPTSSSQRYTPSNSYLCLCPAHCFSVTEKFKFSHKRNFENWAATGWRGWPFRGCARVLEWWGTCRASEARLSRLLLAAALATGPAWASAASRRSEAAAATLRQARRHVWCLQWLWPSSRSSSLSSWRHSAHLTVETTDSF